MARFDVFPNPDGNSYLLDVQSNVLNDLNLHLVVPLIPREKAPIAANRLNPVFQINGKSCVMMTQYMASVPASLLKKRETELSAVSDQISSALDMAFYGF